MARGLPCAGDLRERVELQTATQTRDAIGGIVMTWATTATLWAKVEQMSAREQWHREQLRASAGWRVTIRHRTGVTTKQRVVWAGRTLEITGVTDIEQKRRFLALACDERVAP